MADPKKMLRELVEEVLDEMTGTGAVAGYMSPNAFRGKRSKKASTERSIPGGKVVDDSTEADDTTITEDDALPILKRSIGEGRYNNFKKSDMMRNHAKVSFGISEAKRILREVEFLGGICVRLK